MGNDAKRTILTKLFDEVVYMSGSVSVKLSFLAESIAKRSSRNTQMELRKCLTKPVKVSKLTEVY